MDAFAIINAPSFQQFDRAFSFFTMVVLLVSAFCGVFFNKLYCRRVLREIRATQEKGHFSSGSPEYHYALAHRGGVNTNAVLVAVHLGDVHDLAVQVLLAGGEQPLLQFRGPVEVVLDAGLAPASSSPPRTSPPSVSFAKPTTGTAWGWWG